METGGGLPTESLRRVAILGPAPPDRGGIAHETARLAEELAKLAAVDYLTFSRPYPRWLDPRRFGHDARLKTAPAEPVLDYLSPLSWHRVAARIAGGDALIVPWWTSFWAVAVRAVFGRLQLSSPETLRLLLCHNLEDHEGGVLQRLFTRRAFLLADGFVVHSQENRRELGSRYPHCPATVLPLPALERAGAEREAARRMLQVDGRLVLFLGLIRRYKGVDLLIDAAPRIVQETGARIAVVGEVFPDARETARRWRASPVRDRILWKDQYVSEEEMALWLGACDVLVLPYRRISGSAIAARGIGARRPIAAAAVGSLKETVLPGVTGELFEPGDADGLADAVRRVFERGAETYAAGLDAAARHASWPKYAEGILRFVLALEAVKREA